ncbi:MAG: mechanosensitive ion channel family protein [Anaerolineales bacterium]
MDQISLWLEQNIGIGPSTQGKILASLAAVLVLWILRQILLHTLIRRIKDPRSRYQWRKTSAYILFIAGVLVIWPIWIEGVRSIATYLGLVSAGLAVALRDPITDLMGWAFIMWRRSFEVGDRVQIGDYAGDVVDQRIFKFSLMEIGNWVDADQSTGRILHIPNGMIFTHVLANYTKGSQYIWNEIPVLVTFESNWKKAKQLLQDIAREHSEELVESAEESFRNAAKRYMLHYGTLTSIVYTSVKASGVLLTIRYLCEPRKRRDSTQTVWEAILEVFGQHADIDFAYPTQRFYDYSREGDRQELSSLSMQRE